LFTGILDATGGKAIHYQRDIAPARYEFGHPIAGICREPIASMEIDNGRKRTASVWFRQVAFNGGVWHVRRHFAALASLTLLDLPHDERRTVELN